MSRRLERVKVELKKEISKILHDDLKDPRIGFITVTRIDLTPDLKNAKVYFSILGDDINRNLCVEGIQSAAGYIRKLIGQRLNLRYTPELSFRLDESAEYIMELEKTFERLRNESKNNQKSDK